MSFLGIHSREDIHKGVLLDGVKKDGFIQRGVIVVLFIPSSMHKGMLDRLGVLFRRCIAKLIAGFRYVLIDYNEILRFSARVYCD